jgi:hypothetical protein
MNDKPVELDSRRGMAAQKSTDARRRLHEVQADQAALRSRQDEYEQLLVTAPSVTNSEIAAKARYLIELYRATHDALDPRRQKLIEVVLKELEQLGV